MANFNHHRVRPRPAPRGSGSVLSTSNWQPATTRAFTLIELLIVLAIIGAVVALGVPLFGVLTGAKSVEAGRNIVAATIGQARTVAVNQGKYAGVMFYVDPATERTAMSIVTYSLSTNEDPDPYDKYKSWVSDQTYYSGRLDLTGLKTPPTADRSIGLTASADATYRASLYAPASTPTASDYLNLFGNYRPIVRTFRCVQSIEDTNSNDQNGTRPPRNGPYNVSAQGQMYVRPNTGGGSAYPMPFESIKGAFTNTYWGSGVPPLFATGEQTLLPRGVGLQVLIQPSAIGTTGSSERYVRVGLIMFDPQGRLVLQPSTESGLADFRVAATDTLGKYIQLAPTAGSPAIKAGVGVALYDTTLFKSQNFTDADAIYQQTGTQIVAPTNPSMTDYASQSPQPAAEVSEEIWLDGNATPLIVNRYSGSLSDAQ